MRQGDSDRHLGEALSSPKGPRGLPEHIHSKLWEEATRVIFMSCCSGHVPYPPSWLAV